MQSKNPHIDVWYREEIPERFHFTQNDRIADILVAAENRWDIQRDKAHWDHVSINIYIHKSVKPKYSNLIIYI